VITGRPRSLYRTAAPAVARRFVFILRVMFVLLLISVIVIVVRLRRATLGLRNVRGGRRRGLPDGLLLLRGLPDGLLLRGLPVLRRRLRTLRALSAHDGQALDAERAELAAEREGTAVSALLLLNPADAVVERVVDGDLPVARDGEASGVREGEESSPDAGLFRTWDRDCKLRDRSAEGRRL